MDEELGENRERDQGTGENLSRRPRRVLDERTWYMIAALASVDYKILEVVFI